MINRHYFIRTDMGRPHASNLRRKLCRAYFLHHHCYHHAFLFSQRYEFIGVHFHVVPASVGIHVWLSGVKVPQIFNLASSFLSQNAGIFNPLIPAHLCIIRHFIGDMKFWYTSIFDLDSRFTMCLPTAWHHQAFQLQKAAALSFLIIFLRLCLHMVATKVVACECVNRFSIIFFHADFFRTLSDLQRPSLRRCHRSCECSGRRGHHQYGVVCWCKIRHEEGQFVFCGELFLGTHTQHLWICA